MRLGSPAFAAAVSVFMALSVGPVSAIPPTSGSTAGITLSGPNEAYVYYRGWIRARLLRAAEGLPAHVPARLQAGRILSELLLLWLHVPECLLPTVRLSRRLLSGCR